MTSNFQTCYISCGCNRTPHAADWGRNGLICYGSCNSVAVYDPSYSGAGKIIHTLHHHKGRVNAVRWLRNSYELPENEFVSASADGTAILWSWNDDEHCYNAECVLIGHTNIVNVADGLIRVSAGNFYEPNKSPVLLATASIDSTVKIWKRNEFEGKVECIETIDWGSGFCLDVRLTPLPYTNLALLACAADDSKIHIYSESPSNKIDNDETGKKETQANEFIKVHVLSGHEDWVRSMDFVIDVYNDLYLASCSQDTFIRIWKFSKKPGCGSTYKYKRVVDLNQLEDITPEEKMITVGVTYSEYHFSITLESVLAGHENWVYGISWHPVEYKRDDADENAAVKETQRSQKLKLLSASLDKTMIIWAPDKCGVWTEEVRVGEVGGNTLGFYGGKFGPHGRSIMGHGYQGSFHIWRCDEEDKTWNPSVIVGGHVAEVIDLNWDPTGVFVLTAGSDQTTRLHAPWVRNDGNRITWHEIARPQVHGYDLSCIAVLSKYKFVSGAEEKVIRAFEAPDNFKENFRRISRVSDDDTDNRDDKGDAAPVPTGAAVPALSLSNKAIYQAEIDNLIPNDDSCVLYFTPLHLKAPPTEENLLQNTLWPEIQKLYGHGYEIYSLAARSDGLVLASASKATTPEHASIIIWNAKTWLQTQRLQSHTLTVTELKFSPDGKYLLSVSRDRRWSLFQLKNDGRYYELYATTDKNNGYHTRIIWCCAWTHDSLYFATGSRDGKIGVWGKSEEVADSDSSIKDIKLFSGMEIKEDSVTAVAFAPCFRRNFYLFAIGLESGKIFLLKFSGGIVENLWVSFQGNYGHALTVKKLAFRPKLGRAGIKREDDLVWSEILQLASCGSDHTVKIYDVFLNLL